MAYLSKSTVKQLLDGRPADTTPEEVVEGLMQSGHILEGLNEDRGMLDAVPLESVDGAGEGLLGFGRNVLKSGGRLARDVGKGLLNVFNPDLEKNTVANVARLGVGTAANAVETVTGNEDLFDAPGEDLATGVGKGFVERYGDEGIGKTLYEDPVGVLADVTTAIGGAGAAAKGLGAATGAKAVSSFGDDAVKMASKADPVLNAGRAVKGTAKLAGKASQKVATEAAGVTTGAGAASFQQALDNPAGVKPAMRGQIDNLDILDDARQSLNQLKSNRATDYSIRLEKLSQNADELDFAPVMAELDKQMKRFNIRREVDDWQVPQGVKKGQVVDIPLDRITYDPRHLEAGKLASDLGEARNSGGGGTLPVKVSRAGDKILLADGNRRLAEAMARGERSIKATFITDPAPGPVNTAAKAKLDFSRSTFADDVAAQEAKKIISVVEDWGSQADDFRPHMMDQLKRRIDNVTTTTKAAEAFKTAMKNKVKDAIAEQVPEYRTMLKNYEKASQEIDEITKALSLGDRASNDTAIRKLTSIVRQNNEYRQQLVKELEDIAGRDITGKVSGVALSSLTPRGLMRSGAGLGVLSGILPIISLGFTSPRILGEFFTGIGVAKGVANRLARKLSQIAPEAVQVPLLESLRVPVEQ